MSRTLEDTLQGEFMSLSNRTPRNLQPNCREMILTVVDQVDCDLANQDLKEDDKECNAGIGKSKTAPVVVGLHNTCAAVERNDTLKEEDEDDDLGRNLDVLHDS